MREFTGHTKLVTQLDMSTYIPSPTSTPTTTSGTAPTDAICSVSDDGTARVFLYNAVEVLTSV